MLFTFKLKKTYLYGHRFIANLTVPSAAVTALLTASIAHANPVVNGQEISWPDNGWYEVQSADGLTSICQGVRTCLAEPGQYIVINHTTGERFENIFIGDGNASGNPGGVTVVGILSVGQMMAGTRYSQRIRTSHFVRWP